MRTVIVPENELGIKPGTYTTDEYIDILFRLTNEYLEFKNHSDKQAQFLSECWKAAK